jgi:predicted metalloprotease with PDZ domain
VRRFRSAAGLIILFFSFLSNLTDAQSIQLSVDLTDAARNIYHSRLTIPVKPGPFTLVYPEWIPGNHRPAGPIANVTGVKMEAGGQTLPWHRDPVDMYAFHVDVPAGVNELQVSLDTITNDGSAGGSGPSATTNVLDLNWNQVVLYPQGASSDAVQVAASVSLPCCYEWKFGTALPSTATLQAGGHRPSIFTQFP